MHHHVQIIPHRTLLGDLIGLQNMPRVKKDIRTICQQRTAVNGKQFQSTQRSIKEPQVDQQRVTGEDQNILRQLIQFFLFFSHTCGILSIELQFERKFSHSLLQIHSRYLYVLFPFHYLTLSVLSV